MTSRTSRSGPNVRAVSSAVTSSEAVCTSKPTKRRLAASSSWMLGSSSTTRIRASAWPFVVVTVTVCRAVLRVACTAPVRRL